MEDRRKIVMDTLEKMAIPYEIIEHEAVFTVEQIEEIQLWNHPDGIGAKNLFLRDGSGKRHFLIVLREDKQADLKELRKEIQSSRLSFASAERLDRYMKLTQGSVSPFGVLNDTECAVEVFFDEDLRDYQYIAVHPNDNTATVWLKLSDLVKMIETHGNSFQFVKI